MTSPIDAAATKATATAAAAQVELDAALAKADLDAKADNYAQWRGLFEVALQKFTLDDHICASSSSSPDAQWLHFDALVRSWLYAAVTPNLLAMVMDTSATAYTIWSRIEGLYRDNANTRAIYLEQEFHSLMQGSLSVADYCHKQKSLADELTVVGTLVLDRSLVLNTLRRLSPRFAHTRTLISMQRPLSSFLETCSALLLEELTFGTDASSDSSNPSALVASSAGLSNKNSTGGSSSNTSGGHQSRGPFTNCGSNNYRRRNNGCGSGSSKGGGGNNNSQGSAPWLSLQNPWAGSIQMWPGQGP
ncbi:uncharacterized protein LOC133902809 [Phragmites australis]|uniref:uncharacterized protein LOC133902809 n=1 Tax=Phragmites australis TaxID=29695 RepID=UPI002D776A6F|nr:uncharacterized protein LOC133902809 [Phragmites australis]